MTNTVWNRWCDKPLESLLRHRLLASIGLLLFLCFMGWSLLHLSFDSNFRIWFEEDDPYLVEYDRFMKEFGNDDMFVIAFHDPEGIFRQKPVDSIQRLTAELWKLKGIIRVDSLTNFQATRSIDDGLSVEALFPIDQPITPERLALAEEYVRTDPLVVGSLLTADHRVAILRGKFAPSAMTPELPKQVYTQLMALVTEETHRTGYRFYFAGGPLTDQAFDQVAQTDMGTLVPIVLGMMIVGLYLFCRTISGVVIPIGLGLATIVCTMGITALLEYKMNTVTVATPHLLMGIAVATALHLLSTFYHGIGNGMSSFEAAKETVRVNGLTIVMTSLTTAIGFFSFQLASIVPIQRLGFMAGVGTLCIMVLSLTMVPMMLSLVPNGSLQKQAQRFAHTDRWGSSAAQWLQSRGRFIVMVWVVVGGGLVCGLPQLAVDSDPVGYFKSNFWFSQSIHFLEEKGSGAAVYELVLRGDDPESVKSTEYMQDLDRLTQYLMTEAPGKFVNVYSLSTVLKNLNRSLHEGRQDFHILPTSASAIAEYLLLYTLSVPVGQDINDRINVDYSASRLTVVRPLVPTRESRHNIDIIMAWAKQHLTATTLEFTGRDVLYTNMGNNITTSLLRSLLAAVGFVTLLIALWFRSIRIAVLSLIPNLLPLVVVLGLMGWLGILLDVGTIMVASVGFGVAVDDTIHFLSQYMRYRRSTTSEKDAVACTLSHVGLPILITSMVLVSAFLVFIFGNFMPNAYFGGLLSVMLIVAFLADVTLLPSIVMQCGKWVNPDKTLDGLEKKTASEANGESPALLGKEVKA